MTTIPEHVTITHNDDDTWSFSNTVTGEFYEDITSVVATATVLADWLSLAIDEAHAVMKRIERDARSARDTRNAYERY